MTCQMMMSLGVYVLGAAQPEERLRVESHLPICPACRAELVRLTPLPSLLARVPDGMLAAGRPAPARVRGRSGRSWRVAAVAASVAAVAGAAGGFWLAPERAGHRPPTVTFSGADPAMRVSATASLTATSWGTRVQLRLRGAPLNVRCSLIVRSRAGGTEVVGSWDAWRDGPISVPASAAWRPSDIASLEVTTATTMLVTIRADRGSAAVRAAPARLGRIP
jgi:hypothetical protein